MATDPSPAVTDASEPLTGQVVIVTGASRGIGRGLALGLARAGAAVVCAARSDTESAGGLPGTIRETADAIRGEGGVALPLRCDIGVEADITSLVDATRSEFGRLDVLVNNAMAPTRTPFVESTAGDWDESMRINVRSLYLTARAAVPVISTSRQARPIPR